MNPNEALIRASFFIDKMEFLSIGIPEDECWSKIYAWRQDPKIVKDCEENYLLLQGKHLELGFLFNNGDDDSDE